MEPIQRLVNESLGVACLFGSAVYGCMVYKCGRGVAEWYAIHSSEAGSEGIQGMVLVGGLGLLCLGLAGFLGYEGLKGLREAETIRTDMRNDI